MFGKFLDFEINQATLSGCIDIIVVEQSDGTLASSPFHVRFGKLKVFNTKEKLVSIKVNGIEANFKMRLGNEGQAFFEQRLKHSTDDSMFSDDGDGIQAYLSNEKEFYLQMMKKFLKRWDPLRAKSLKKSPNVSADSEPNISGGWFSWREDKDKEKEKERKEREEREKKEKKERDEQEQREKERQKKEKKEKEEREKKEKKEKEEREKKEKKEREEREKLEKKMKKEQEKKAKEDEKLQLKVKRSTSEDKLKNLEIELDREEKKGIFTSIFGMFRSEKSKKEDQVKDEIKREKDEPKKEESKREDQKEDISATKIEIEVSSADPSGNATPDILTTSLVIDAKKEEINQTKNALTAYQETENYYEGLGEIDLFESAKPNKAVETKTDVTRGQKPETKIEIRPEVKPELQPELLLPRNDISVDVPREFDEFQEDEPDIELSLCGDQINSDYQDELMPTFIKHKVSFEKFLQDPQGIIENPNLLIRIDSKLYEWKLAAPLIVCLLAFRRQLPEDVLDKVSTKQSSWKDWFSRSKKKDRIIDTTMKKSISEKPIFSPNGAKPIEIDDQKIESIPKFDLSIDAKDVSAAKPVPISEEDIQKQKEILTKPPSRSTADESFTSGGSNKTKVKKTLKPTSDMLKSLNLKEGCNQVIYTVTTSFRGEQEIFGYIYLWSKNAKIVISDVDGTITKSDVLGQVLPFMGKDWSHPGITTLYNSITRNGYHILYLTARAVGQSETTRNYLTSLQQDQSTLPKGPVIMSPDRLMYSFKREVIYKRPEVFKIATLREIKSLFPAEHNPFYSGFGNRETDAIAYREVGIPEGKIFIINPNGVIHQPMNRHYQKSYRAQYMMADLMFPPVNENDEFMAQEEFNQFNYFKPSLDNLVDQMEVLKEIMGDH